MESAGRFPRAVDESLVGTYPALTRAGGGYVWDAVLEYRVWCHPLAGAPPVEGHDDYEEDDDYFRAFSTYEDALRERRNRWPSSSKRSTSTNRRRSTICTSGSAA